MPRQFEKPDGLDWIVDVLVISEDEIYPVTIFGAVDAIAAEREALRSFTMAPPDDLRVITVKQIT